MDAQECQPIRSMTGYGRAEVANAVVKVSVELATVNRKQFDCNVYLPREWVCLENALQKLLHTQISRGYVKGAVNVTFLPRTDGSPCLNLDALTTQVQAIRAAALALDLPDTLSASDLLTLEGGVSGMVRHDPEEVWPLIEEAAKGALEALSRMREREGAALVADLRARFVSLRAIVDRIAEIAPSVPKTYQETLRKRLTELLPGDVPVDPEQLAREVALFADRCDISEELTRLVSHFSQAENIFAQGGSCGRALDFLCQEFFREINTTGSKANHAEIARLVIDFKTGLEAIREQVQNIE